MILVFKCNFIVKLLRMKRFIYFIIIVMLMPLLSRAQKVTYSDYEQDDNRDINFEVIGKMQGNVLVYKNVRRWQHRISILGADMKIKETVKLDFVPEKTFNVDFVSYPDFCYMIYQYQKKNILHCMAVKLDANAQKIGEPIEIDTTQIPFLADNKIYTTIYSEDKQKIMVFKMPKKNDNYSIGMLLFNSNLKLIAKDRQPLPLDERRNYYSNFLVDNEGTFVFTKDTKSANRENSNLLEIVTKQPNIEALSFRKIDLDNRYIDEVKLKIDNLNRRYIINSFYYKKSRGSIEGLLISFWNKMADSAQSTSFMPITDSIREKAKTSGQFRFAMDDFFIRQVVAKKDGGFLLTAEDYSTQSRNLNNNWSRYDYLNNYYYNPNSYYYNPYTGFYRPLSSFGNQSTKYYYSNILIMSFDKTGQLQWNKVINKDQSDDDNDNFLSYSTFNSGAGIHFLFNDDKNKNQIIANHSITGSGQLTRNPTLKSQERGYMFMPRLSKQIGASQLIIPCVYRGYICFARVDL